MVSDPDSNRVHTLRSSYDAVIVGARCAGGATAMLLARAGLEVLLIEQGARGGDTLSTLALMRAGVLQLSRWGLLDAIKSAGTPPVHITTFHYGDDAVEIPIKPRDGVDALYAPRRTVLDPLLADAAAAAGAHVAYRVRLKELVRDANGRVTGAVVESDGRARQITASIVIGADGVTSTVARTVDAQTHHFSGHMAGVIYTRASGLAVEGYHWHFVPGSSVGVIPTNDNETLVFAATTRTRFLNELRFDLAAGLRTILHETAPSIAAALDSATLSSYHGFAGHPGFLRQPWGPGWALVGDAGYFKDPATAHGITDALRDAEALAQAVLSGTESALAAYQAVRDHLSLGLFTITDEIASYGWDLPRLRSLHKSLSEEMTREVRHVTSGRTEGDADRDAYSGTRAALQSNHRRLQPPPQ
jgi:2-polyprenyl-6-methoxyphenol hydroxylase-like FAD-dependent oxidoreductase